MSQVRVSKKAAANYIARVKIRAGWSIKSALLQRSIAVINLNLQTIVSQGGILSAIEYQMQLQQAVDTLKAELPTLFEQDISYDIYTKDVYFQDPVNKFKGKISYRIIFWTLRFHGQLFFTEIYFDLHDVSQTAPDAIVANWTVRGTLRVPWKAQIFFNGYSTYKLDEDGLIYDHVDTWDRKPGEILKQFFRKGEGSNN